MHAVLHGETDGLHAQTHQPLKEAVRQTSAARGRTDLDIQCSLHACTYMYMIHKYTYMYPCMCNMGCRGGRTRSPKSHDRDVH